MASVGSPAPGAAIAAQPSHFLERFPRLSPPVSTARAAVTIVLRSGGDDVEVLLIELATNPLDLASGQVALPGGHVDGRDGSLADTALRELEEEVGIPPADVLETLRYVRTAEARRFGLQVGVFAAELPAASRAPSPRSAVEVAHVFWLPRGELARTEWTNQLTSRGELAVPTTRYGGHALWGFTRRVLREFFSLPAEDPVLPAGEGGPSRGAAAAPVFDPDEGRPLGAP